MNARNLAALALLPAALFAQAPRPKLGDVAPLKYWSAPLYWQPSPAERAQDLQAEATPAFAPPAPGPLLFVGITPCRVIDTRAFAGFPAPFGVPALAGAVTRNFPMQTSTLCSIPPAAHAYSLNVTVVPPGPLGFVTVWPQGSLQPNASTLNSPAGLIVANAAIIPAGTDTSGSLSVYASDATDLVVDINGYYVSPTNTTNGNTSLGAGALTSNTTGMYNTATGESALGVNTTGAQNTANGEAALNRNTAGTGNTAVGFQALFNNTTGNGNVAVGSGALTFNTTASNNTATGGGALAANTTGAGNTATGNASMQSNTTGALNASFGAGALQTNTTGSSNTAVGQGAMGQNTTAGSNTSVGQNSLANNTTGCCNVAVGQSALNQNTTATSNTAVGESALFANTTGAGNSAVGQGALIAATTGGGNTALGQGTLLNITTGASNVAVGVGAGSAIGAAGNSNIHISNVGKSTDDHVTRIGTYQTSFFAAGIRGTTTGSADAVAVVIDSNGQLGTVSSSERFKEDIHDMAGASDGLLQLRPVTYRYKQPYADGSTPIDYGLIAEEVAQVYPDLVAHDANGQIETVQYQKLTPMLLNELQKQHQQIEQQAETIQRLEAALAALAEKLR